MILIALAGIIGSLGALLWWRNQASAAIPPEEPFVSYPTHLSGTFLPSDEDAVIVLEARRRGVDARLLAAIRKAEMGGPGREFGILSTPAPTYADQARIAANTIGNNITRYEYEQGISVMDGTRYSQDFIAYLGRKYAPVGAGNDPTNLNANWIRNVSNFYGSIDYA